MASGQQVGYIRVSTADQNTARQLEGVQLDKIFEERCSGKNADRPQLKQFLEWCRSGDTAHLHSMDRLARNLTDLREIVDRLTQRGVAVVFHKEGMTFKPADQGGASPMDRLLLSLLGAVAEFERSLILERQKEGIAIARQRGVYKGRKKKLTPADVAEIREEIASGIPKADIAAARGISRPTLYEYLRSTPWTEH
jgi:DNA invertase Pin-like site-specific DNA recombinase